MLAAWTAQVCGLTSITLMILRSLGQPTVPYKPLVNGRPYHKIFISALMNLTFSCQFQGFSKTVFVERFLCRAVCLRVITPGSLD